MDREILRKEEWEAWRREDLTHRALVVPLQAQVDKLKASWLAGELTSPTMSANEIAVANMAAVETAQFATYLIHMTYEDYLTAMEKE
jgi:hypothetical protein